MRCLVQWMAPAMSKGVLSGSFPFLGFDSDRRSRAQSAHVLVETYDVSSN